MCVEGLWRLCGVCVECVLSYPRGSVNRRSLLHQRVSDTHMTLLSHQVERSETVLERGGAQG